MKAKKDTALDSCNSMIKYNKMKAVSTVVAAVGINLVLGLVYIWSVISQQLVSNYNWTSTQATLPYTLELVAISIFAVLGGRFTDTFSPRLCVMISGTLVGIGLVLSSFTTTPEMMAITYGILTGAGIGACNSATTATAMKWFPPERKGLISGVCLAGGALSAVYMTPIVYTLIKSFGVFVTFRYVGIGAFILIMFFSIFFADPKNHLVQYETSQRVMTEIDSASQNVQWREMLRTPIFYKMWFMFIFSTSAGLMIIGNISTIATKQAQWENGFLLVMLLSIFNGLGRFTTGTMSDKLGIKNTLRIIFIIQAINMILFSYYHTALTLAIGTAISGFCYGGGISLVPPSAASNFGINNLASNYALLNTSYGVGGTVGPLMAGMIVVATGSYHFAYLGSAVLLLIALVISFMLQTKSRDTN